MTPTEQDKELRERLAAIFYDDNYEYMLENEDMFDVGAIEEAMQLITSLIKELVEEAKPSYCDGGKKCICSTEMEQYINSGKETAIIQFEQNLLKELEEV